ncbi:hypothetical protein MKW98_018054 [Papaver atlanticum]|uniref:Uncharacterized protein n=1 Tax=Papaver atlanticum TaxID=357466 RepID=A0AAD4XVE3_9MAGN|nr:hypothetical protein MKW98_018054 [Papaver atlanticum]
MTENTGIMSDGANTGDLMASLMLVTGCPGVESMIPLPETKSYFWRESISRSDSVLNLLDKQISLQQTFDSPSLPLQPG